MRGGGERGPHGGFVGKRDPCSPGPRYHPAMRARGLRDPEPAVAEAEDEDGGHAAKGGGPACVKQGSDRIIRMLDTATAAIRFGLGARPDDRPPADPRAGLIAQFDRFEPAAPAFASAPTRAAIANDLASYLEDLRQLRADKQIMPDMAKAARQLARGEGRDAYLALVAARTNAALVTPAPFVERLVHFWANHFAVSADKLTVVGMAGLLESEAIRPHVLGHFSDMLLAVETHPAMLLYLDQAQSIGPESAAARFVGARNPARKLGLNENLAREILELHTLGVRTGYTQADVTEFARALTGWTVAGIGAWPRAALAAPGTAGNLRLRRRAPPARRTNDHGPQLWAAGPGVRRAPCSTCSPPTQPPGRTSRPSSHAISPGMCRHPPSSRVWPRLSRGLAAT